MYKRSINYKVIINIFISFCAYLECVAFDGGGAVGGGGGEDGELEEEPLPRKWVMKSIGSGKMIVEFFSAEIEFRVWWNKQF